MTYNVFGGTLNLAQPQPWSWSIGCRKNFSWVAAVNSLPYFTVRRYASAVYAVVVRLPVSMSVCVCHTPVLYQNG